MCAKIIKCNNDYTSHIKCNTNDSRNFSTYIYIFKDSKIFKYFCQI